MESHPSIEVRTGPAGRRPGLVGGPDLWEVVAVFQGLAVQEGDSVRETAVELGLSEQDVRTALRYYATFPDEIDAWIQRNNEASTEAEASWKREQSLLQR